MHVVIYEEPEEEEEGIEASQWSTTSGQVQVKATQDGHDTQSQALPRSRNFTGARMKAQTKQTCEPPPFQTPPDKMEMDTAMEYVIKTMAGVAARSDQMYRGYLDRVAEKEQMLKEIKNEVRKAVEDMRKEIREEMRKAKNQEWNGIRKQIPLPPKPESRQGDTTSQSAPEGQGERKIPTPPKVVIPKKRDEEKKREAAKGEKKYVAPLPGYDDNNTSSGSTPLWSKKAATKGEWTTVVKKTQTPTATREKVTPEEAIRNRNIIIERPKLHKIQG